MKCFYHNDHDGRSAGAVVAHYENNYNPQDFIEVDYVMKLPLDIIQPGERVYFVDYSFKENTIWQLEKVIEVTNDIIWIDHHTSSLNLEELLPWTKDVPGIRKDGISGVALTYMYLHKVSYDELPYFIKLVSDYDCWQYKYDPDTTYFKLGVETLANNATDVIWATLLQASNGDLVKSLIEKGEIIKGYIDRDNDYYRDHFAYETEIEGYKCLVVNKKSNSWVFGDKYKEYPLVMVWVFNGEKFVYSLYSSNKDVDCSKIAEKFGGGGHKGASGFSSDTLLFKKV